MKKQDENLFILSLKKDTENSHDSSQYDTARNLTLRNLTLHRMILRGTSEKLEYLGENDTKKENIITHWSVAQAGSNDEKNWGSKISFDCPFNNSVHSSKKSSLCVC